MSAAPADFQDFQRQFAQHLRDPRRARPAGVSARGTALYRDLVFNNILGFLDACFPVCRAILGDTRWRRLNRCFYRDWPLHTPWFREIPREFVRYLMETKPRQTLPQWLPELAHYEWAELAVDTLEVSVPAHDPQGDLLGNLLLNPAILLLSYAWPVHQLSPQYRPRRPQVTHLVVYRDAQECVQFSLLNGVTARLLALLSDSTLSGAAALSQIAEEIAHPDPEQLKVFGQALLEGLRAQGIILGTHPL